MTRPRVARSKHNARDLWDLAFVSPQFILFAGLTLLPFLISIPIAFTDRVGVTDPDVSWVGFDNFVALFRFPLAGHVGPAIGRTCALFLGNYLMVFLVGLPLALFLFELRNRYRLLQDYFFTLIFLPYMIPGFGLGLIVTLLFSRDSGSLNLLLMKLGWIGQAIDLRRPESVLVVLPLIIAWAAAGFNMALFLSGLLSIPSDTIEAATVDGATYLQKLRHVYFPQMVPSFVMATIFALLGTFASFDILVGLGALLGNPAVELVSIVTYKLGFLSGSPTVGGGQLGTLAQGVALQIVISMPLMVITWLLTRVQRRWEHS